MSEGTARCARHPEAVALLTCARCGDHACAACAAGDLCARCAARVGSYAIPWETADPKDLGAFVATARALAADGRAFFRRFPDGPVGPALSFLFLPALALELAVRVLGAAAALVLAGGVTPLARQVLLDLGCAPFVHLAVLAAFVGLAAAAHRGLSAALGGTGALRTTLRAAAYGTSPYLLWVLATPVGALGVLDPAFSAVAGGLGALAALGTLVHLCLALYRLGAGREGLGRGRSVLAAGAPVVVALLGVALWIALAVALVAAVHAA